jgi:hypothetical protein
VSSRRSIIKGAQHSIVLCPGCISCPIDSCTALREHWTHLYRLRSECLASLSLYVLFYHSYF